MRIAFAYESAYPWFNGGIEKRRFIVMKALAKGGRNEIHMFTMFRKGMPGREFSRDGIRYHCVGDATDMNRMYINGSRRSLTMPVLFGLGLLWSMPRHRFDVVDADSFPFLHLFPLWLYCRLYGARFAVTWHEVWSRKFWNGYLGAGGFIGYSIEWLSARLSDFYIANASTTKRLLQKELGADPRKAIVFPAAVDSEEVASFLRGRGRSLGRKDKFIVISRLVKHKRVELAIGAIRNVKARLTVVGKGPELEPLKELADRLGCSGKVDFRQGLSERELFAEIRSSKALLMPSEREGLSLVTVEALALGTPVVVADTSSLPSELKRLCLEEREDRMGSLLSRLVSDYGTYGRRYDALRGSVMEEFSGDRAAEVYEEIMDRGRGKAHKS